MRWLCVTPRPFARQPAHLLFSSAHAPLVRSRLRERGPESRSHPDADTDVDYPYSTSAEAKAACVSRGCTGLATQNDVQTAFKDQCLATHYDGGCGWYMTKATTSCGGAGWNDCSAKAAALCTGCKECPSKKGEEETG